MRLLSAKTIKPAVFPRRIVETHQNTAVRPGLISCRLAGLVCLVLVLGSLLTGCGNGSPDKGPRRLEVLFLGHDSLHHESTVPAELVSKEVFNEGINITYAHHLEDLNKENLKKYDGLILYGNYDTISPEQADALLDFVREGKGFIPVHCASYCFRNNPEVVELIGGQFKSHEVDSFPMVILKPEHPVMKGLQPFSTYDETYVHDKLSKNITVLTERVQGDHHEPYTWVRDYGKGRVFYTAYGHDEHTWNNPGFLHLLSNGIHWALGDEAAKKLVGLDIPALKFTPANIPNYEHRDPPPQLQAPLSPQESMQLMQVPPGFEVKLFASEPDIVKPIYMNWDERGRLWVIETVDYPNTVLENKQQGADRVKILEDTDGDGKADKITVFADKLNIPTSFCFARGGIIVSQAPYFLFLKDTTGDDRADIRDTLISGWGVTDTHAGPSNLRWGFDNKIWGVVGYAGFKGLAGGTDTLQFSQGLYQFNSDGSDLHYMGRTSNNTWGLGFSEEFDVFLSTANNTHSAFYGIPKNLMDRLPVMVDPAGHPADHESGIEKIDGHYAMHAVTKQLRQVDVHGGFTAAAGHNLYTGRDFPKEYWNRIGFVCEPTGRIIHRAILEPNGSSFQEKDGWNLLASSDNWVGPVQAEVGPDGAVWVADWYNFIIQHNPTPEGFETGKGNAYVNPLRDRTRGRIYRIVYKGRASKCSASHEGHRTVSLDKSKPEDLVAALSDPTMFWRMTAQRLLVESGDKKVFPALYDLVKNSKADEIGINAAAMHALWTLQGLKAFEGSDKEPYELAYAALANSAAGVRKAAINVLPANEATEKAMLEKGVFKDPDLRVRLAAVIKATSLPASASLTAMLSQMSVDANDSSDKWIKKALQIALQTGTIAAKPAEKDLGKPDQTIHLRPVQNVMKFDKTRLHVKAGSIVEVVFENIDFMQHNFLLLQKGSLEKVGAAADLLARDPGGAAASYVPKIPEVLYATPLVNPQGKYHLKFRAPPVRGDYPYTCSFPGHWRIMNGVMTVE